MKEFKSKQATKNAIHKIVGPLTKGFFEDNSWENIRAIWTALEAEGVVVTVNNTQYGPNMESKTWYFDAEVNGFKFTGVLVASFCGTVSDPTSRYDICFII